MTTGPITVPFIMALGVGFEPPGNQLKQQEHSAYGNHGRCHLTGIVGKGGGKFPGSIPGSGDFRQGNRGVAGMLVKQVEEVSMGSISQTAMRRGMSIGVAVSVSSASRLRTRPANPRSWIATSGVIATRAPSPCSGC